MFDLLPNEIIVDIYEYLPLNQLIDLTVVCKTNYEIIHSYRWRHLITIGKKEILEYLADHYHFINFYPNFNYNFWKSNNKSENRSLNFVLGRYVYNSKKLSLKQDLFLKIFSKAKYLNLRYCNDKVIEYTGYLTNLNTIKGNELTINNIKKLNKLKKVLLNVTDPMDYQHSCISKLQCLEINNVSVLSKQLKYLTHLCQLKIECFENISDDYFFSMSKLKKIRFGWNRNKRYMFSLFDQSSKSFHYIWRS